HSAVSATATGDSVVCTATVAAANPALGPGYPHTATRLTQSLNTSGGLPETVATHRRLVGAIGGRIALTSTKQSLRQSNVGTLCRSSVTFSEPGRVTVSWLPLRATSWTGTSEIVAVGGGRRGNGVGVGVGGLPPPVPRTIAHKTAPPIASAATPPTIVSAADRAMG